MDEEGTIVIITGVQGILATLGNFLVMVAVIKFEHLRTCTNFFILSLSVVDFMSGLTEFPVSLSLKVLWPNATSESQTFINGTSSLQPKGWDIACKMRISNVAGFSSGNLMGILYISIDRFICIEYPLKYPTIVTKSRVRLAITVKWVILCIMGVTSLFLMEDVKFPCDPSLIRKTFINGFIIPSIFIFLFTSLTLYLKIGFTAYKQSKEIAKQTSAGQNSSTSTPEGPTTVTECSLRRRGSSFIERKIAKMLGIVMGLYYLSYVPMAVVAIVTREQKDASLVMLNTLFGSARMVYLVSTWINPVVYAWMSKDFRHYFGKLLRIKCLQYRMEDVI